MNIRHKYNQIYSTLCIKFIITNISISHRCELNKRVAKKLEFMHFKPKSDTCEAVKGLFWVEFEHTCNIAHY